MDTQATSKRITLKHARPNPLFQEWLEELYEEAKEKKSKLEPMLKEALSSISKYPLPLGSGAECIVLKGFEKKLCLHLDKRLEVYNENLNAVEVCVSECGSSSSVSSKANEINDCQVLDQRNSNCSVTSECSQSVPRTSQAIPDSTCNRSPRVNQVEVAAHSSKNDNVSRTKAKGPRQRLMGYRTGGYAILVALLEKSIEEPNRLLTKEELIENAQKYCDESFTRPKPETFYTAWSNMTRLVSKGLVEKSRNKKLLYKLTDAGKEMAIQLRGEYKSVPSVNDIIFNSVPYVPVEKLKVTIELPNSFDLSGKITEMQAGSFDIILLIDKNETGGVCKKNDPTVAQFNKYPDLKHEYRSLKVGDFTWIAKHKTNNEELVLPYIVERKRMDDLGASIKDGRFHEQKFRLRKCGLENVIYLVENYGSNKHVGLPYQTLMQAIANTRVQDTFKVHVTDSLTNSVRFLAMMTKRLTIRFQDKTLTGRNAEPKTAELMTFDYFNKSSAKTKILTVTETFIKMLLQLKGMSVEKALAITNEYSTPYSLLKAYENCDEKEGQFLLANLKYGDLNRNVGPILSKSIFQLFSSDDVG